MQRGRGDALNNFAATSIALDANMANNNSN